MVKNWLHYVGGTWTPHYDQPQMVLPQVQHGNATAKAASPGELRWEWIEQGVVYLDPASIVSVGDNTEPKATIICTSDGKQVVTRQKSASEIIGDIQSALAD